MSKPYRKPNNKLGKKTSWSAQKVVSQQGKVLLERLPSKIGLMVGLLFIVCAVVLAVHWPVLSAQAKTFDDDQYFAQNVLVQNPSWASTQRFFTEVLEPSTVEGYYQPLTMVSLMLDYALGGRADNLQPFHRTSLALHIVNTALVIALLYLLFGRAWVAAGVGLLFGLHPMTVEPISWVSDRKTLLAAFFALWCLILYVRFTHKGDWRVCAGCLAMYVLALMSKPTSTPLPILMLLIDFWPLGRLNRRTVLEKLPFFVVGGISVIITYISQSRTVGVVLPGKYGPEHIPLFLCHNIIFYLYKMIWPINLSSHYAFPKPLGLSDPMVLAGVIGTCTLIPLLVISLRWTWVVLMGWLFFFVAIFPTMGVIGFTIVIASDKHVYLPSVGLLMILASFLGWLCGASNAGKLGARHVVVVAAILTLAGAEAVATRLYLIHWRDSLSLFEHMLTMTPNEAPLHNMLGIALKRQGKIDEAISPFHQALQLNPDYFTAHAAHGNLGSVLREQGKFDEAISHFRQALQIMPDSVETHLNLGTMLGIQGKFDEAISHLRRALQINPDFAKAHNNLGTVLQLQGKFDEAISHYHQALQIKPDFAKAHNNLAGALTKLGMMLIQQSKTKEAAKHFTESLRLRPDRFETHNDLGFLLQLQGKLDEAISHYRQALQINPDFAKAHNNLAGALARQGKLDESITHFMEVIRLDPNSAKAHYLLARTLNDGGRTGEAVTHFKEALRLKPDWVSPMNSLAWILATHSENKFRNPKEAIRLAERACELTNHKDAGLVDTLAAAYAAAGRFPDAVTTAEKAIKLAASTDNKERAGKIQNRLELYKLGKPYRE